MNAEKIGTFIAQLRKDKGLTQQGLADQLEVTRKAVSRWETGRGYPDIELLPKLAQALHVSVQELLEGQRHSVQKPSVEMTAVSAVCQYGANQRKHQVKKIVCLSVCLALMVLLIIICE